MSERNSLPRDHVVIERPRFAAHRKRVIVNIAEIMCPEVHQSLRLADN